MACDQILLHSCIGIPLIFFFTSPKRREPAEGGLSSWSRGWPQWVTQAFGVAIVAVLFMLGFQRQPDNLYDQLGLPTFASRPDVHGAFNKMSQEYHPSKNSSKEAERIYARMKLAHEILMSPSKRKNYSRFGDLGEDVGENDFLYIVGVAVIVAALGYCIGAFFTAAKRFSGLRQWVFVYLIGCFSVEVYVRFLDPRLLQFIPKTLIGRRLVFEQVALVRNIFPAVLGALICVTNETFIDQDMYLQRLLRAMLQTNHMVSEHFRAFSTTPGFQTAIEKGAKPMSVEESEEQPPLFDLSVLDPPEPTKFGNHLHKIIGALLAVNYLFFSSGAAAATGDAE